VKSDGNEEFEESDEIEDELFSDTGGSRTVPNLGVSYIWSTLSV